MLQMCIIAIPSCLYLFVLTIRAEKEPTTPVKEGNERERKARISHGPRISQAVSLSLSIDPSFFLQFSRNVCLIDVQVSWRQGRYYFAMNENVEEQKKGKYVLIRDGGDEEGNELGGLFYMPLPCFGLGIGWLSFLLGFFFPFAWYFATFLYLTNYYRRDPRERSGLAASAIAVSFDIHRCTVDHRACSCFLGSLELLVYSFWGGWRSCLLLRTKKTTTKTCNIAANPAKTTPTVSPLFNPPLFGSSGDPNLRGSGGGGRDSDLGCGGCC
uniref:Uncharacterized protein n=1 Tax=Brassica oleracea TaxID=3712 RepID=A0A3P6BW86_BRAOL|nr:unnamed protein product [Brassica oleracea]